MDANPLYERYRPRIMGQKLAVGLGYAVVGMLYLVLDHHSRHPLLGLLWLFSAALWLSDPLTTWWAFEPDVLVEHRLFGRRKLIRYDQISVVGNGAPPHSLQLTVRRDALFQSEATITGMTPYPSDTVRFLKELRQLAPAAEFRI